MSSGGVNEGCGVQGTGERIQFLLLAKNRGTSFLMWLLRTVL